MCRILLLFFYIQGILRPDDSLGMNEYYGKTVLKYPNYND